MSYCQTKQLPLVPHEDLESEAECIKEEYIKQGGGFEPNTMIDYVLEDEQCDMLLGIKNYNLFPCYTKNYR